MKRFPVRSARGIDRPRAAAWIAAALAFVVAAPAGAQDLELPVPELTVEPSSKQVRITWPVIEDGIGRAFTDVVQDGLADFL